MFYLTKKVDYGLNLLVSLAKTSKTPVTLSKIATKSALPRPFLAKLAADLVRAQILQSREGVAGGYVLAREPEKISLNEILAVLEKKKTQGKNCQGCDCEFCSQRDVERPLQEEIDSTLQDKTLADLLTQGGELNV